MPNVEIDYFTQFSKAIFLKKYDMVFLDVLLEGVESFAYGDEIKKICRDILLVYISNFDNFVYESRWQECFSFICKSQLEEDLYHLKQKYDNLQSAMRETFEFRKRGQVLNFPQHKIVYMSKQKDNLIIHLEDKEYSIRLSLYVAYQKLNKDVFFKLNNSNIINLNKVIDFNSKHIVMSTGDRIFFTRYSKSDFKKRYQLFIEAKYGVRQ